MDLPDGIWIDEKTGKTAACRVMAVNHAMNLQDLFRQLFNHPRTLEDLGITEERGKQIMSVTIDAWRESLRNPFALACVLSAQINAADARRKDTGGERNRV